MRLPTSASRRASLFAAAMTALAIAGTALSQQGARRFGFGPPMASDALAAQPQTRGAKGDQQRHYYFADAGQEMPYHLYVPQSYDPATPMPLVVALHGYSGNEDYFFAIVPDLPALIERHGFIFVAPMGYSVGGWYGAPLNIPGDLPRSPDANGNPRPTPPSMLRPAAEQLHERALSERDVLNVLELVRREYNVDPNRTYLMGHSMGGMGTYFLGQKYADEWAAIAPMSGTMPLDRVDYHLDRLENVPVFVSAGETETTTVKSMKEQVEQMRKMGMTAEYLEVPGATHMSMIKPAVPEIFEFFDKHRKTE